MKKEETQTLIRGAVASVAKVISEYLPRFFDAALADNTRRQENMKDSARTEYALNRIQQLNELLDEKASTDTLKDERRRLEKLLGI